MFWPVLLSLSPNCASIVISIGESYLANNRAYSNIMHPEDPPPPSPFHSSRRLGVTRQELGEVAMLVIRGVTL